MGHLTRMENEHGDGSRNYGAAIIFSSPNLESGRTLWNRLKLIFGTDSRSPAAFVVEPFP